MDSTQILQDEKAVFVPLEEIRGIENVLYKLEQLQQELEKAVARKNEQSNNAPFFNLKKN